MLLSKRQKDECCLATGWMEHRGGHMLQRFLLFNNLLTNLFFPHCHNTCEKVCWVIGWSPVISNTDFQRGTNGNLRGLLWIGGKRKAQDFVPPFIASPYSPQKDVCRNYGEGWEKCRKTLFRQRLNHVEIMVGLLCLARKQLTLGEDVRRKTKEKAGYDLKAVIWSQIFFFLFRRCSQLGQTAPQNGGVKKRL